MAEALKEREDALTEESKKMLKLQAQLKKEGEDIANKKMEVYE